MDALEQAARLYKERKLDLWREIAAYSTCGGYVFLAPECVLWGKPVKRGEDPEDQWNVQEPDTWYVRFALGQDCMKRFLGYIPYPLPYVAWKRVLKGRGLIYFNYNQLIRRL